MMFRFLSRHRRGARAKSPLLEAHASQSRQLSQPAGRSLASPASSATPIPIIPTPTASAGTDNSAIGSPGSVKETYKCNMSGSSSSSSSGGSDVYAKYNHKYFFKFDNKLNDFKLRMDLEKKLGEAAFDNVDENGQPKEPDCRVEMQMNGYKVWTVRELPK